jgi:hypothetical protein
MRVDITDTGPGQAVPVDKMYDFPVRSESRLRQSVKVVENYTARPKMTERKFANHEWVDQNPFCVKQLGENLIASPKVVYPDRRIGQDHFRGIRRRGGAFN